MRPLKIYLGDLSYFNKYTRSTLYTPLNIGYIASYAKKIYQSDIDISLFKDPKKLLEACAKNKPDIVGLSVYYWNTDLNKIVVSKIKNKYGGGILIAIGGPSIDTDANEQFKMFEKITGVDVLVPDEGELGFASLIDRYLSKNAELWNSPIPGAVFKKDGRLVRGEGIGFPSDLSQLPSPYLSGQMDQFLVGDFQPLIQTSRGCPYTCTFCVAGKTRCLIRAFPVERVKEEITFIAKAFVDRPHFSLYITDVNFGLLPRDAQIAEYIKKCASELKYPKQVFFYTDKRFTKTSSQILESMRDLNLKGFVVALQSENPCALEAIHRFNLKTEEIDAAISWAASKDLQTSTEMIFGLPFETKESFANLLEKSVERGFDSIICHNLFLMDGIEMNREDYRKKYCLTTKYRLLGTNYGSLDNAFSAESEEVVVSTSHFSFSDFEIIRCLNFLFYAVYTLNFYKWFFHLVKNMGIPMVKFFMEFMNPDPNLNWPKEYLNFISDFKNAFKAELFESREEVIQAAKKLYMNNGGEVGEPTRLNVIFGVRLIYLENSWVDEALREHLHKFIDFEKDESMYKLVNSILDLCQRERINLKSIGHKVSPMMVEYDLVLWKKDKFKTNVFDKIILPRKIFFSINPNTKIQIGAFNKEFGRLGGLQYYYNAIDFILRPDLVYNISYEE